MDDGDGDDDADDDDDGDDDDDDENDEGDDDDDDDGWWWMMVMMMMMMDDGDDDDDETTTTTMMTKMMKRMVMMIDYDGDDDDDGWWWMMMMMLVMVMRMMMDDEDGDDDDDDDDENDEDDDRGDDGDDGDDGGDACGDEELMEIFTSCWELISSREIPRYLSKHSAITMNNNPQNSLKILQFQLKILKQWLRMGTTAKLVIFGGLEVVNLCFFWVRIRGGTLAGFLEWSLLIKENPQEFHQFIELFEVFGRGDMFFVCGEVCCVVSLERGVWNLGFVECGGCCSKELDKDAFGFVDSFFRWMYRCYPLWSHLPGYRTKKVQHISTSLNHESHAER